MSSASTMEVYSSHGRIGTVELAISRRTAEKMEVVRSVGWDRSALVPVAWAENIRRMDRSEARMDRKRRQEIRAAGPGGDQMRDPDDPSQGRVGSKELTFSDAKVGEGEIEKGLEVGLEPITTSSPRGEIHLPAWVAFWESRCQEAPGADRPGPLMACQACGEGSGCKTWKGLAEPKGEGVGSSPAVR